MKNIYDHLFGLLVEKKKVALATVTETKGSAPQVSGASAIFSSQGLLEGTLGGGLLEANAQKKALAALKKKNSLLYKYSLDAGISSEEEAICGGQVKILIDATPEEHKNTYSSLHQSFIQRQAGLLATIIKEFPEGGISLSRHWIKRIERYQVDRRKSLSLFKKEIKETFSKGKPALVKIKDKMEGTEERASYLFLEPIFPLPQLVIVGAGHIGRAVAHLGNLLNFEVTVTGKSFEF